MSYRDKLLAIAARLHERPLSDKERHDLGKLVAWLAANVGELEEWRDDRVEEYRHREIAAWDMGADAGVRVMQ